MKDFLNYYHDELLFLRQKGEIFAKKHPNVAEKLDIKNGESSDPQTERIIESVAFMAAKLHQKIDSNAQNIAFFLLSALYPNLINVFPPCGIAKFENENTASKPDKLLIKKGTSLFVNSKNDVECQFRTLYPITLYPIDISNIQLLKTAKKIGGIDGWSLEINIITKSIPIELMELNDLLFYINLDIIEDSVSLYESIFSDPNRNVFLKINEK
ncbi:MAG: type VI secretion system baseplate subunit TssF, partial [Alphaproteobacteria bacterium]|nr:type VI secretion system baseplate subunit TssF [Alphaproteobacteria bacterium]